MVGSLQSPALQLGHLLVRLQYLKTFWTPSLRGFSTPLKDDWLLVERQKSQGKRKHVFYKVVECRETNRLPAKLTLLKEGVCADSQLLNAAPLLVLNTAPENLEPNMIKETTKEHCRRLSVALFYNYNSLKPPSRAPPQDLEIKTLEPGDPSIPEFAKEVQKRSWGFYVAPPRGVFLVAAFLRGRPVATAYFNPKSKNIDYGVHVVRELWGRGIGSRVFMEIAKLADRLGASDFSVVRVLRGKPVAQSDKRALMFYLARGPVLGLLVCEANCG